MQPLSQEVLREPDRRKWEFHHIVPTTLKTNQPEDLKLRVETGVINGDCLAACFAAGMQAMHLGHVLSDEMDNAAARLRRDIVEFAQAHWFEECIFMQDTPFHTLFHMAHDVGIPAEERKKNGPWPDDPKSQLERYLKDQSSLYMCEPEIAAFVWMMYTLGKNICVRSWRRKRAPDPHSGFLVCTMPDENALNALGIEEYIVIDIEHTGSNDSRTAHYKLVNSGSLLGLARVSKKRRVIE